MTLMIDGPTAVLIVTGLATFLFGGVTALAIHAIDRRQIWNDNTRRAEKSDPKATAGPIAVFTISAVAAFIAFVGFSITAFNYAIDLYNGTFPAH